MNSRKHISIIVALFFLAVGDSSAQSPAASSTTEIPTVAYCDVIANPSKYDQKVIRLSVSYFSGHHVSNLYDTRCDTKRSTYLAFDESYKSKTKKEVMEAWERIFNPPSDRKYFLPMHTVDLVIVGEFQSPARPIEIDGESRLIAWRSADKHQFIIHWIEEVRPTADETLRIRKRGRTTP